MGISENMARMFGGPVPTHKPDLAEIAARHQASPPQVGGYALDLITGWRGKVTRIKGDQMNMVSDDDSSMSSAFSNCVAIQSERDPAPIAGGTVEWIDGDGRAVRSEPRR